MNKRRVGQRRHHVSSHGQCHCKPDLRFELMVPEQIMSLPVSDDASHSLKTYTVAYHIAMAELTGSLYSEFATSMLNDCSLQIKKRHLPNL